MMNPEAPSKLYALIIGINTYQASNISPLRGCVADATNMQAYLQKDFVKHKFAEAPSIKSLINEQATKKNILEAFESHLGQATSKDVAFFYFAGHGIREKTDIHVFKEDEFDGNISSLTCHDTDPWAHADGKFAGISDRELRFFIHQLYSRTQTRIITIFDCCQSGENTRSLVQNKPVKNPYRQIQRNAFNSRSWDGYDFGKKKDEIFQRIQAKLNLQTILPEGKHIQLAACREVELAQEFPPEAEVRNGVFTSALLDVLTKFEGDINYDDLYLRVLNRMPTYNQTNDAQTPQIYLKTDDPNLRFKTFLTHESSDRKLTSNVVLGGKDGEAKEWRITSGALQAIPIDQVNMPTKLVVKSRKTDQTYQAKIVEVFPGYSRITFTDQTPPQSDATLYAEIDGLGAKPLKVFVGGPDAKGVKMVKDELTSYLKKAETQFYELVDNEDDAEYTLFADDRILFTTKPFNHEKPLVKAIGLVDKDNVYLTHKVGIANQDLIQMANWHFLQKLNHSEEHDISAFTDSQKTMFPIELAMYLYDESTQSETRLFPDKHNTFTFDLTPEKDWRDFRIDVLNHSDDDYSCSLLYLSNMYEVSAKLMSSPQLLLGPNQKVMSSNGIPKPNGKKYIKMHLKKDPYIKNFNWDGISYYFKLIVSKTPFDVEKLEMKGLPIPEVINRDALFTGSSNTRGGDIFDFEPEIPKVQWEIHTFELRIVSPFEQTV
ncbi:MAG: caspase family protein [Bacteroidetes bacterium]|nr:caspase family protein [Bacteroidota bacterium]